MQCLTSAPNLGGGRVGWHLEPAFPSPWIYPPLRVVKMVHITSIHFFCFTAPVETHYSSAHQPPLAARPITYLFQTGSSDISIHPRPLSVLPTVMFHPRFRHYVHTTAAVFYLTSSGRSACSSLYSRQAGVSGFGCHRLERPASPRRICAVTRGFQTTTQDLSVFLFLPRQYLMTRVLLSPFITTVSDPCNN